MNIFLSVFSFQSEICYNLKHIAQQRSIIYITAFIYTELKFIVQCIFTAAYFFVVREI